MNFPTFRPNQRYTELSASELQHLSNTVRALSEVRGGPGVNVHRVGSGMTIGDRSDDEPPGDRVMSCAMYDRLSDAPRGMMRVCRVGYAAEPPLENGDGPYAWRGIPFFAYAYYGTAIEDFEMFQPEVSGPESPARDQGFFPVQADGWGFVAWMPQGSLEIDHAVIRSTGSGFERMILVQRIRFDNRIGDYRVVKREENGVMVDDVIEAIVVPGMLSMNYESMVLPLPHEWHTGTNTVKLYRSDGRRYAEQTPKFALRRIDPNLPITDCVLREFAP